MDYDPLHFQLPNGPPVRPGRRESVYSMLENRLIFWTDEARSFLRLSEKDPEEAEYLRYVLSFCLTEFSVFRLIRCHEEGKTYLEHDAEELHKQLKPFCPHL